MMLNVTRSPRSKSNSLQSSVVSFFCCLTLLALRSWDRLTHPELWAEDAHLFSSIYNSGFGQIAEPVAGYYHFIQKSFYFVVIQLAPFDSIALLENIFCLFIASFVFSRFTHRAYRWLAPSDSLRFFCSMTFCFLAGLNEMVGNLPNLNWILHMWLLLVLLKDPGEPLRIGEGLGSILCFFSVGTGIVLFPVYLWRFITFRKKNGGKIDRILATVMIFFLIAQAALFSIRGTEKPDFFFIGNIWLTPFVRHIFLQVFVQPFFGDTIATGLWHIRWLDWSLRVVVFIPFVYLVYQHRSKPQVQGISLALIGTISTLVLCWMARPLVIRYYAHVPHEEFWRSHYSFPLAFVAFLFWVALIGIFSEQVQKKVVPVLIILTVLYRIPSFPIKRYGKEERWKAGVQKVKQVWEHQGLEAPVAIPIYPDNWSMDLNVKGE